MITLNFKKENVTKSNGKIEFTKTALYKGYTIFSDETTMFNTPNNKHTINIVNVTQNNQNANEYSGNTILNLKNIEMQNFYERMNKRFGG